MRLLIRAKKQIFHRQKKNLFQMTIFVCEKNYLDTQKKTVLKNYNFKQE
jgi:hypothetical protein